MPSASPAVRRARRDEESLRDHRDFLAIPDFTTDELYALFDLAERMRDGRYDNKPLKGKSLAMIFMKSSTRTRVSFEVGTYPVSYTHLRAHETPEHLVC